MKSSQFSAMAMALLFATAAFAQTDTVFTTLSQENGSLAPQQFISEYDRAFETMTPAKWMLKLDLGKTLNSPLTNPSVSIGAEAKLGKAISIDLNYQYSPTVPYGDDFIQNSDKHRYSATLRWYYDMKKRIAAGKSASNFSGNYFSVESAVLPLDGIAGSSTTYEFAAKFGLQRRLLRFGYFDLSYGIGAIRYPNTAFSRQQWAFSSKPQAAIGLAFFGPSKNQAPSGTACDVLRCFEENRRLLKIDLYNLLDLDVISNYFTRFTVTPSIAYEQKIGNSPFSAEVSVLGEGLSLISKNNAAGHIKIKQFGLTGMTEMRWYFLQKRRMLQGKSGNNLSGVFAGMHAAYYAAEGIFEQNGTSNGKSFYNTTATRAVLGVQRRFLDHGFIQFKVGAGSIWKRDKYDRTVGSESIYKEGPKWNYYAEFKAGLAF